MAVSTPTAPRPATKDVTPPAPSSSREPLAVFRFGSVSAAVFGDEVTTRDGERRTLLHASLRRAYQGADGTWQHTHSLRATDLLPAALALMKAYEFAEDAIGKIPYKGE